jgi:hypothetical protein
MAKKNWQIVGTKEFGESKQELKVIRDKMNADSGFTAKVKEDELTDGQRISRMPYKLTKGPDHPNYAG